MKKLNNLSIYTKITKNMYLYDIQFKLWHGRVATNTLLYRMNMIEFEEWEYCNETENITHAFILRER